MSLAYGDGFFLFDPVEWRRGPVPLAADTRYRPPRPAEILSPTRPRPQSTPALGRRGCSNSRRGLSTFRLALSITNQWRIDNDPPFPSLADFAAAWNRISLKPLRFTHVRRP